jgi:hypothetical protein
VLLRHTPQIDTVAVHFAALVNGCSNQPLRFAAAKTWVPLGPRVSSRWRPRQTTGIKNRYHAAGSYRITATR